MADDEFAAAVEDGLGLAKRINTGGAERRQAAPRPAGGMERTSAQERGGPTAPMVCAVIHDPGIVDNPDIPSYQPYVYGRCDPPALIPLQMTAINLEVECVLDTAFVVLRGRWRVHCVTRSRSTDCRLFLPMGEQGSVLGVEVEVGKRSFSTRVIEENDEKMKMVANEGLAFLKPQLFSLTIPQVNGGSDISTTIRWSQKLMYKDGQFSVMIPFHFPEYVNPLAKVFSKKEKIQLIVNTGMEKEVLLQHTSHPLKELSREVGKLSFFYEALVENWSSKNFNFSYDVYSNDVFGGVILQSPPLNDFDQRDMFCLYLFPGNNQKKVFRKEVIFVVDISGSMHGKPLENVKSALSTVLLDFTPDDSFNIIAFNDELHLFSSSLELATMDMVEKANQWISKSFVAVGGTDIMHALDKAIGSLSSRTDAIPHIFLITDGSTEDEHKICEVMKAQLANGASISPRISTFGIGSYCNHYFLRMLASFGRGQYDSSYNADSVRARMGTWFARTLSPILTNITIDVFNYLDELEVFPFYVPDLSAGCPLIISGRSYGKYPHFLTAKGSLADTSEVVIDLKVQNTKDFPFEKAFSKQHIDLLTAQAWFSENRQLQEKVTKLSIRNDIPSEYTYMVLLPIDSGKSEASGKKKKSQPKKPDSVVRVRGVTVGFGDVAATKENLPTGVAKPDTPDILEVYNKAVGCCSKLGDCCCCMCFINCCSKVNDQFVIAMTQLCTALSCLACSECCSKLCCPGSD